MLLNLIFNDDDDEVPKHSCWCTNMCTGKFASLDQYSDPRVDRGSQAFSLSPRVINS